MGIFALGDLHLSHASSKPMDVFGPNWAGHEQRIQAAWTAMVTPQDIVLVPGDISWAMHMAEAAPDLAFIASLPGRKVLLRGNHDYWWSSLSKVRSLLQPDMFACKTTAFAWMAGLSWGPGAGSAQAALYSTHPGIRSSTTGNASAWSFPCRQPRQTCLKSVCSIIPPSTKNASPAALQSCWKPMGCAMWFMAISMAAPAKMPLKGNATASNTTFVPPITWASLPSAFWKADGRCPPFAAWWRLYFFSLLTYAINAAIVNL